MGRWPWGMGKWGDNGTRRESLTPNGSNVQLPITLRVHYLHIQGTGAAVVHQLPIPFGPIPNPQSPMPHSQFPNCDKSYLNTFHRHSKKDKLSFDIAVKNK